MRINPKKCAKFSEELGQPLNAFLNFLHSRSTKMHRHECNTHNFLFNLENQTVDFSYAIFPVKKNKCWKNFKIMRKLLFKYSLYSHPKIVNFRV
jgi:hypothetical protein